MDNNMTSTNEIAKAIDGLSNILKHGTMNTTMGQDVTLNLPEALLKVADGLFAVAKAIEKKK